MAEVIDILKKVGGIITDDHFVYTSGKHGSVYINKDALYPHTEMASRVGELFAEAFQDEEIDIVVAPALGGIILSQWTADHLSNMQVKEILAVYTEKDEHKNQVFTRGYGDLVTGKNVLIIEDLVNTGGSFMKVVKSVEEAGGYVAGIGVMVNRSPKTINSLMFEDIPFVALDIFPAEAFDESECPYCKEGRPINTKVGHGKKYLEAKGN